MAKIKYEFREVNISEIIESEINPQQMNDKDFERLVENIKKDGCLTSSVLIMMLNNSSKFRCISGHHRIKAARKAGLKHIPCMVIDEVDKSTQYRLQLAHNDIHGEPDAKLAGILIKELEKWDINLIGEYETVNEKSWEGKTESIEYQYINICLMPETAETLKTLIDVMDWDEGTKLIIGNKDYDRLQELLTIAFKKGFKTPGKAFRSFLDNLEKKYLNT